MQGARDGARDLARLIRGGAAAALAVALASCAAAGPPVEWRLLLKLRGAADPVAVATAATGLPARFLGSSGGGWSAIALRCPDEASCHLAVVRLRADTVNVDAVQSDERRRIVTP